MRPESVDIKVNVDMDEAERTIESLYEKIEALPAVNIRLSAGGWLSGFRWGLTVGLLLALLVAAW